MTDSLESKFESLCGTILKPDIENWDHKNRAVIQMTELIKSYQDCPPSVIQDAFSPELYRMLKEPIKLLITDLRSQQVRDTCAFLIELSKISGDKMKLFLRDSFIHILEGIKVPNKVMSGYVDECIIALIQNCVFKSSIPPMALEIKENKAKFVREKCLEYFNEMLMSWELNDKELEPICESIKIGLEDASPKAREMARSAFSNLLKINLKKAEKIKNELPKLLASKLPSSDDSSVKNEFSSSTELDSSLNKLSKSASLDTSVLQTPKSSNKLQKASTLDSNIDLPREDLVTKSAQSSVKNAINRRRSVVKNPFADLSSSYASSRSSIDLGNLSSSSSFISHSPVKSTGSFRTLSSDNSPKHSLKSSPEKINNSKTESISSNNLTINMKIIVLLGNEIKYPGTIRFIGHTLFAPGIWIGVELDEALGKNNGSVKGHYYFTCPMNFGLFVREENILVQSNFCPSEIPNEPNNLLTSLNNLEITNTMNLSSVSTVVPDNSEKRVKSSSKLKLKLSQLMDYLNQQLEIVEELENYEKADPNSIASQKLRQDVLNITSLELDLIINFHKKWKDLI